MKQRVLTLALVLMAGMILSGCASGPNTEATADDKANIDRLAKEGIKAPGTPAASETTK